MIMESVRKFKEFGRLRVNTQTLSNENENCITGDFDYFRMFIPFFGLS